MALAGKQIKNTYKDILTVNSGTDNQGIESSLKTVSDGEGVATAIQLSTTTLKIPSGKTLEIAGTLNSVDATLTGDLTVEGTTNLEGTLVMGAAQIKNLADGNLNQDAVNLNQFTTANSGLFLKLNGTSTMGGTDSNRAIQVILFYCTCENRDLHSPRW